MSPTMEKGNIAKWMKKEGDSIKPGDILAQIETDKATVDFEMQEEGFIAKLMFPEGAKDIKLGQVVAIIVDSKDDIAKFKDFKPDTAGAATPAATPAAPKKQETAAPVEQPKVVVAAASSQQRSVSGGRVFVSPLAKRVALDSGLDLSGMTGSGPNNRIIVADVEAALAQAKQ